MYHSGSTRMYLEAMVIRYEASIANAKVNLQTYFRNGVGVAEHPDIISSVDSQIQIIAEARDKLQEIEEMEMQEIINA